MIIFIKILKWAKKERKISFLFCSTLMMSCFSFCSNLLKKVKKFHSRFVFILKHTSIQITSFTFMFRPKHFSVFFSFFFVFSFVKLFVYYPWSRGTTIRTLLHSPLSYTMTETPTLYFKLSRRYAMETFSRCISSTKKVVAHRKGNLWNLFYPFALCLTIIRNPLIECD